METKILFTHILLIVIVGIFIYSNSLNSPFIMDDIGLVRENVYIKSWSNIPKIFTHFIGAGYRKASCVEKYHFYRPLQTLSYMVDYSLWGLDVRGFHLTSIILHILTGLSVYWLIVTLFNDRFLSLLTGLLFVINPLHTETVNFISGRADSLGLFFMLLSFIFYIRHSASKRTGYFIVVLVTYILALLSKENSLILPLLLLSYHYCFKKKLEIKNLLYLLGIASLHVVARMVLLKNPLPLIPFLMTLPRRIPGFFVAITHYIRLLLLPVNLHYDYGNMQFAYIHPATLFGFCMTALLLFHAFKKRSSNALASFAIFWFFMTLIPVSNIFYPLPFFMAEHYLYMPSIAFFLVVAKGLSYTYRTKGSLAFRRFFIICVLFFYAHLTIQQNAVWKNPITFYAQTLKFNPRSSSAYNNLGLYYREVGDTEKAIVMFKKALMANPRYEPAYMNLAFRYKKSGKIEKTIQVYKKVIEMNPNAIQAYINLGDIYVDLAKYDTAIRLYEKVLVIDPNYAEAYYALATVYGELDRKDTAMVLYRKTIEIDPNFLNAYNNIATILISSRQTKEAIEILRKALEINPDYALAHHNLAVAFFYEKRYELATQHSNRARELGFDGKPEFLDLLHQSHQSAND